MQFNSLRKFSKYKINIKNTLFLISEILGKIEKSELQDSAATILSHTYIHKHILIIT